MLRKKSQKENGGVFENAFLQPIFILASFLCFERMENHWNILSVGVFD
jgi:hypothetical protein